MEIELNSYRFQNDKNCRIMLCDYTGGEGRNFQCADYIVHIDLPWDASTIEQRIGRLDRLVRDPSRPVVHSVLVYDWIFGWKRQYCDRPTRVDGNRKTSCRNAEKADPYYEHGHACGISNCLTVGEKVFGADEGGWERKGHAFCS